MKKEKGVAKKSDTQNEADKYCLMYDAVMSVAIEKVGKPFLYALLKPFIGDFVITGDPRVHHQYNNGPNHVSPIFDATFPIVMGETDLETQRFKRFIADRALYYMSNLVVHTKREAGEYYPHRKRMFIAFCDVDPYPEQNKPIYRFCLLEKDGHFEMGDGSEYIFINCHADGFTEEQKAVIHDLYCKNCEDVSSAILREGLSYSKQNVKLVSERWATLMDWLGYEEAIGEKRHEEGLSEGRAEGHNGEKRETARRLAENGYPLDVISCAVGLSPEDTRKLLSD